jgi:predicted Fe-S protein YdhL (DUF1289 family)
MFKSPRNFFAIAINDVKKRLGFTAGSGSICCSAVSLKSAPTFTKGDSCKRRFFHVGNKYVISVMSKQDPLSPCIGVCTLNPNTQLCDGCLRTMDEIAAWAQYSSQEKREVRAKLEERYKHLVVDSHGN